MRTLLFCLLFAAFLISVTSGTVTAEVITVPMDTELLFYIFITFVAFIVALVITIELKRKSKRRKSDIPSSSESEEISRF